MERQEQWLEAIFTVVFDLEQGQLPDLMIPADYGTDKDRKTISYNSFPDSFTFSLEGQIVYSFYLRKGSFSSPENGELLHCYACFSQKKDPTNARGYFQKSIVFLTKVKVYIFFKKIFEDVAKRYFATGDDQLLKDVFQVMNTTWSSPTMISDTFNLELLGKNYEVCSV